MTTRTEPGVQMYTAVRPQPVVSCVWWSFLPVHNPFEPVLGVVAAVAASCCLLVDETAVAEPCSGTGRAFMRDPELITSPGSSMV